MSYLSLLRLSSYRFRPSSWTFSLQCILFSKCFLNRRTDRWRDEAHLWKDMLTRKTQNLIGKNVLGTKLYRDHERKRIVLGRNKKIGWRYIYLGEGRGSTGGWGKGAKQLVGTLENKVQWRICMEMPYSNPSLYTLTSNNQSLKGLNIALERSPTTSSHPQHAAAPLSQDEPQENRQREGSRKAASCLPASNSSFTLVGTANSNRTTILYPSQCQILAHCALLDTCFHVRPLSSAGHGIVFCSQ